MMSPLPESDNGRHTPSRASFRSRSRQQMMSPLPESHIVRYTPSRASLRGGRQVTSSGMRGGGDLSESLLLAVRRGGPSSVEEVTRLIQGGASVNAVDSRGLSVLQGVLLERGGGEPAIVRLLLERGARATDPGSPPARLTALHIAAKKGYQVAVVKQLLQYGADPSRISYDGETALHEAVKANSASCVRPLLDVDDRLLMSTSMSPSIANVGIRPTSPLVIAAKNNQTDILNLLLTHAAVNEMVVDEEDIETGRTALHWASLHGNAAAVANLLQLGADVRRRDADWATCFALALSRGHRDVIKQLVICPRCDVNACTDRSFMTAMHVAARDGLDDIITLLADADLDVNVKCHGGLTPLALGAWGGHVRVVHELLRAGANVQVLDRNHASALVHAVMAAATDTVDESRASDVIRLIVRHNGDLDIEANLAGLCKTHNVHLPGKIRDAVVVGDRIADGKMEKKNPENMADEEMRLFTALEIAFICNKPQLFVLLLKAGCDVKQFHCDPSEAVAKYESKFRLIRRNWKASEISTPSWCMLNYLYEHQRHVPRLTRLCRRAALSTIYGHVNENATMASHLIRRLPISVQELLKFRDLQEIDQDAARMMSVQPATSRRPEVDFRCISRRPNSTNCKLSPNSDVMLDLASPNSASSKTFFNTATRKNTMNEQHSCLTQMDEDGGRRHSSTSSTSSTTVKTNRSLKSRGGPTSVDSPARSALVNKVMPVFNTYVPRDETGSRRVHIASYMRTKQFELVTPVCRNSKSRASETHETGSDVAAPRGSERVAPAIGGAEYMDHASPDAEHSSKLSNGLDRTAQASDFLECKAPAKHHSDCKVSASNNSRSTTASSCCPDPANLPLAEIETLQEIGTKPRAEPAKSSYEHSAKTDVRKQEHSTNGVSSFIRANVKTLTTKSNDIQELNSTRYLYNKFVEESLRKDEKEEDDMVGIIQSHQIDVVGRKLQSPGDFRLPSRIPLLTRSASARNAKLSNLMHSRPIGRASDCN